MQPSRKTARLAPITIRHLIHHTSGIQDYLTLWTIAGAREPLDAKLTQELRQIIERVEQE